MVSDDPVATPSDPTPQVDGSDVAGVVSCNADEIAVRLGDGRQAVIPASSPLYEAITAALPAVPPVPPCDEDVDRERDRRISILRFDGVDFQCDAGSQQRITAAGLTAKLAVLGGAQAGNLRWMSPDADFGWIAAGNTVATMDAQHMAAFSDAATAWVVRHALAARALKDMNPMPSDYATDRYWPSS
jgi:hypothetical protein